MPNIGFFCRILWEYLAYYADLEKEMILGTLSLPLEDQDLRINEHNIRKLGKNLGEIQGGCPPSLTLKSSQGILMRSPPTIRIPEATK